MKMQLNIVDPNLVSEDIGATIIVGVMHTDKKMTDFDLHQISLRVDNEEIVVGVRRAENDSLLRRDPDLAVNGSFHLHLTKPIWKPVDVGHRGDAAGELSFVNTSLPTPDGQAGNNYVFFGLVRGDMDRLFTVSGRVHEVELKQLRSTDEYVGKAHPETIHWCPHEHGHHLTHSLELPVWGFGQERYGMRSTITEPLHKMQLENRNHLAATGKHLHPQEFLGPVDKDYAAFLRAMQKEGALTDALWVTKTEMDEMLETVWRVVSSLPTHSHEESGPGF